MNVTFSRFAGADLESIYHYIADNSGESAADKVVRDIEASLQRLAEFPNAGRDRSDLLPGLRSYPVISYLVLYRIEDGRIVVVRIAHGSQDIPKLFN